MLNKKLVIAALLAAAYAQAEGESTPAAEGESTPAAEGETPAAEGETPAAEGETPAAEGETPAEGGETPAEGGDPAPETPAETPAEGGEGEGKGDASDDEKEELFEKARKAWKETIQDAEGNDVERVLCDQGEDALWEEAAEHWKELKAKKKEVDEAVAAAKIKFDEAKGIFDDMKDKAAAHKDANKTYLENFDAAEKRVADLQAAASGNVDVAALQGVVDGLVSKTEDASDLVDAQLLRMEKLVDAKRTQTLEEGLWEERVTAADAAKSTAETGKQAADDDLAFVKEQVTTRSWLYETLNLIKAADYASGCNASAATCDWMEDTTGTWDTSKSPWIWPASCQYKTDEGTVDEVTHNCTVLGLNGSSTGLVQSATAMKGTVRDGATAPTELELAYETADYTYVSASTLNADSQNSSLLLNALEQYEAWQKKVLAAEMVKVTAWKAAGGDNFDGSTDLYTWVKTTDGVAAEQFHPLMQGSDNATSYVSLNIAADAAQGNFDHATEATNTAITATQQTNRAVAQVDLWFADWYLAAYNNELTAHVGVEADKASVSDWLTAREIGKAEAAQTLAQTVLTAATNDLAAVTRWEAIANQEGLDAQTDIERGRALLKDLVADVVPIAREEFEARAALEKGKTDEATRAAAEKELGEAAVADPATAATGARAVLAAAQATKDSVEQQQAFHDSREEWAADNLAPVQAIYDGLVDHQTKIQGRMDEAEDAFDHAREQCKAAAFEAAQEAREKAQAVAAAMADKVAEVKKAYGDKAAFADAGKVGALCHYPKVGAEEAAQPRPPCDPYEDPETQEKPICCGAAQRFLKDGTKLSIETCQLASATTYTYYPALPADAVVAPTAETWRFQCISAAQKLAAAAAAALATGYMMA